jgi:hypothetical protein
MDVSSGDEDAGANVHHGATGGRNPSSSSSSVGAEGGRNPPGSRSSRLEMPVDVRPLSSLHHDFPYVLSDAAEAGTMTKKGSSSSSSSSSSSFSHVDENVFAVPSLSRAFENLVSRCALPHHAQLGTGSARLLTSQELGARVSSTPRADLPISDAAHEDEQLVQAGARYFPSLGKKLVVPACASGDKCEALVSSIEGCPDNVMGFALGVYFFPDEWKKLCTEGIPPANVEQRPCVLCHRARISDLLTHISAHESSLRLDEKQPPLFQLYRNPVNGQHVYRHTEVHTPPLGKWIMYYDPVVAHRLDRLRWMHDNHLSLWRIDQSRLKASAAGSNGSKESAAPLFQSGAAGTTN